MSHYERYLIYDVVVLPTFLATSVKLGKMSWCRENELIPARRNMYDQGEMNLLN